MQWPPSKPNLRLQKYKTATITKSNTRIIDPKEAMSILLQFMKDISTRTNLTALITRIISLETHKNKVDTDSETDAEFRAGVVLELESS